MIKVTVNKSRKQESKLKEKTFPKLMIGYSPRKLIYALGINEERNDLLVGILLHTNGSLEDGNGYSEWWVRSDFHDYNEPVIIQNKRDKSPKKKK